MSRLVVSQIQGSIPNNNTVSLAPGNTFSVPGLIVQTVYARTDVRTTYSSNPTGNGTTITDMNIVITPKFSTSLLLITWMINGELHQDNVFLAHQDGALITTAGYQGYNNVSGNVRWSGLASGFYDVDENSTPSSWIIQYAILAASTSARTYAPAVRSSSSGTYTFSLNRTIGQVGQDAYENMISTGMIMELAQ
jgi:hypothetical protein